MGSSSSADDEGFNEPRIAINRVYTRHGDGGKTRLVGGQQVEKDDARIEAYGTVDELNAIVGIVREGVAESAAHIADEASRGALLELGETLLRTQHELFNLGSILATLPEDVHPRQPRITAAEVTALEAEIDRCQAKLGPLRSFVLPGGCRLNAELHLARTVCRRAERRVVALGHQAELDAFTVHYLNRLGDALFVWSRWISALLSAPETLWQPNYAMAARKQA